MRKSIYGIIACVFLLGCSTNVPVSTPTQVPVTQNLSVEQRQTPLPAATQNIISSKTPTPGPDSIYVTAQVGEQICSSGTVIDVNPFTDISPDGKWMMVNCNGEPANINVFRLDGLTRWSLPLETVSIDGNEIQTYLQGYLWTSDGAYAYFVPYYPMAADGGLFFGKPGLLRLSLETGQVETILKPFDSYGFSISPNDQYLIYNNYSNPNTIIVRDMASNIEFDELIFKKKYSDLGFFVWAPDSTRVVFVGGQKDWDIEQKGLSLFIYDLAKKEVNTLIENDNRNLYPSEDQFDPNYGPLGGRYWLDAEWLVLESWPEHSQWKININTAELKEHNPINFKTHFLHQGDCHLSCGKPGFSGADLSGVSGVYNVSIGVHVAAPEGMFGLIP